MEIRKFNDTLRNREIITRKKWEMLLTLCYRVTFAISVARTYALSVKSEIVFHGKYYYKVFILLKFWQQVNSLWRGSKLITSLSWYLAWLNPKKWKIVSVSAEFELRTEKYRRKGLSILFDALTIEPSHQLYYSVLTSDAVILNDCRAIMFNRNEKESHEIAPC